MDRERDIEEGPCGVAPVHENEEMDNEEMEEDITNRSLEVCHLNEEDYLEPVQIDEESQVHHHHEVTNNNSLPFSETSYSELMTFHDSRVSQSSRTGDDDTTTGLRKRNLDNTHQMLSNRGMVRTKGRHQIGTEQNMRISQQGQHVQIRNTAMKHAMDENARRRQRWKKTFARFLSKAENASEDEGECKISMHGRLMVQPSRRLLNLQPDGDQTTESDDDDEKRREETQFRLTTIKRKRGRTLRIPGMYEDLGNGEATECCFCCPCPNLNSDRAMSAFLHWSFRSPFVVVFGSAAIGWLAFTFIFALGIYILGYFDEHCIGGVDFGNSTAPFMDAYQISWTTFSTVGFGLIYPATSANHAEIHQCTLITILTTFESFVGVLFSSLCAALMFAKVARVQSFAQVTFSDPIVIRYGTGVTAEEGGDDEDEEEPGGDKAKKIPCPVLEFRIFNRMSDLPGGEIIDATLNMVAIIDVTRADSALMARNSRRKKGKKKKAVIRKPTSFALRYNRGSQQSALNMRIRKSEDKEESPESPSSPESPASSELPVPESLEAPKSLASPGSPVYPLTPASTGESTVHEASTPANTVISKPDVVMRHRSVAASDATLPLKGPAPAILRTNPKGKANEQAASRANKRTSVVQINPKAEMRNGSTHRSDRRSNPHNSIGSIGNPMQFPWTKKEGGRRQRQDSAFSKFFGQQQPHLRQVSMRMPVNQQFEEDPSGKIIPKKMLSKLEVETPDHPFFRLNWLVRHTLDVNSLLLKPHVRQMLERNGGFWPPELNNYESIRASLEFDQILVSFSGTSNADANSVYAQHVYHMVDVNIGYRFVNALYRCPRHGSLRIDQTLINDVMEQAGGGGEPLQELEMEDFRDIMVL